MPRTGSAEPEQSETHSCSQRGEPQPPEHRDVRCLIPPRYRQSGRHDKEGGGGGRVPSQKPPRVRIGAPTGGCGVRRDLAGCLPFPREECGSALMCQENREFSDAREPHLARLAVDCQHLVRSEVMDRPEDWPLQSDHAEGGGHASPVLLPPRTLMCVMREQRKVLRPLHGGAVIITEFHRNHPSRTHRTRPWMHPRPRPQPPASSDARYCPPDGAGMSNPRRP